MAREAVGAMGPVYSVLLSAFLAPHPQLLANDSRKRKPLLMRLIYRAGNARRGDRSNR